MARQLAFDLAGRPLLSRADFFTSPANEGALRAIEAWAGWPGGKMLLVGAAGTGKTHLARIWAGAAGARVVPAAALAEADLPALGPLVVVEDAEGVAGVPRAESALLHLHNLILPEGRLLITAARPPRDWPLTLADLQSRLQASALTRLEAPDDALLAAVLVKLFADRQIAVSPGLIAFLAARIDRSLSAASLAVATLDARALALGRPVTRALAMEIWPGGGLAQDGLDTCGNE